MPNTVIKVENLSKLYRLGEVGTGTISHDLNRWWARVRGKEDPFTKVGNINDRTQVALKGEHIWALKDINFEVKQGEVLGIIGKNGAGKSTLLKILSRITSPTNGQIKIKGRVASLLEVGTGMHPEMTGKENVFLNGTILGMSKKEVDKKIDNILDFAGCLKYADTPVKRYSSGMRVRLGFAVAAFLDPEILIVDEVLAVGDAEFQKKAIGKIKDISRGDGRTVLFVSHNMDSISRLCNRTIILSNGELIMNGETNDVIQEYLSEIIDYKSRYEYQNNHEFSNYIKTLTISSYNDKVRNIYNFDEGFKLNFKLIISQNTSNLSIGFAITSIDGVTILNSNVKDQNINHQFKIGENNLSVKVPPRFLNSGEYVVKAFLVDLVNKNNIQNVEALNFVITENGIYEFIGKRKAFVIPPLEWKIKLN